MDGHALGYEVESRDVDFDWTCEHWGSRLAVVRRDVALSPSGVRR